MYTSVEISRYLGYPLKMKKAITQTLQYKINDLFFICRCITDYNIDRLDTGRKLNVLRGLNLQKLSPGVVL